jgi:hypothetical protein
LGLAILVVRNGIGQSEAFVHSISSGIHAIPLYLRSVREIHARYLDGVRRIHLDRRVVSRIEISTVLLVPPSFATRTRGYRSVQRRHIDISGHLVNAVGEAVQVPEHMQKRLRKFVIQPGDTLMGYDHAASGIDPCRFDRASHAFRVAL